MWQYKNCVCYDNDISKMMVMYLRIIVTWYVDSLCDDYNDNMLVKEVEEMIVMVGKGPRVFAEDSKQRERKMRGIMLINYDDYEDDHNYHS